MSDSTLFLVYAGIILMCAVRAHNQGRSIWSWVLFAIFLPPLALLATIFTEKKTNRHKGRSQRKSSSPKIKSAIKADDQNKNPITDKEKINTTKAPTPNLTRSMFTITKTFENSDSSIIDVSGQEQPLIFTDETTPPLKPATASTITKADFDYDSYRLSTRFQKQLALTKKQTELLDKFWSPHNVFIEIEGCLIAVTRLFLVAMPKLEKLLEKNSTSLDQELKWFQEEYIRRNKTDNQNMYWFQSGDTYLKDQALSAVYSTLFRRCENEVREAFGHKRKLDAEFSGYYINDFAEELEKRIGKPFNELIPSLRKTITPPDEATEIALNRLNVNRWKPKMDDLSALLTKGDRQAFTQGVYLLGKLNAGNSAIENIFFDASKLMAKHDREESLRFYVHYLHHDMQSTVLNNKQLAKTIQKSLFSTPEEMQRFEELVQKFLSDKDLEDALAHVPLIYAKKRKKIQLDANAIHQVQDQHAGTVQLLNNYLNDELETESAPLTLQQSSADNEEVELILQKTVDPFQALYLDDLMLTSVQHTLLQRFAEVDFTLSRGDVEAFASENGVFRNQLIDSINTCCADLLDDVLIEEDGDSYSIFPAYYNKLIKQ